MSVSCFFSSLHLSVKTFDDCEHLEHIYHTVTIQSPTLNNIKIVKRFLNNVFKPKQKNKLQVAIFSTQCGNLICGTAVFQIASHIDTWNLKYR